MIHRWEQWLIQKRIWAEAHADLVYGSVFFGCLGSLAVFVVYTVFWGSHG